MNNIWDAPTRRYIAIGLIILLLYLVYLSRALLPNLILAAVMAFALAPVITFLHKQLRIPKPVSIILSYILFILILLLLPAVLIPAVATSFTNVDVDIPQVLTATYNWLIRTLESFRMVNLFGFDFDLSPVIDQLLTSLSDFSPSNLLPSTEQLLSIIGSGAGTVLNFAAGVFGTVSSLVGTIFITFLLSIFMSTDSAVISQKISRQLPPAYKEEIITLGHRIHVVWWKYIGGQVTLGFIIFLITWIFGTIIGLPGAFALAVIAGLLEFIPNLGPLLAAIPAALIALLQGSQTLDVSNLTFFIIVVIMYVLIQQLENNLIVPKVLGDALDFPPVLVMIGVLVGFSVAGILGALLAVPFMATGRELVAYAYAKVLMRDPFPPLDPSQEVKLSPLEQVMVILDKARAWVTDRAPKPAVKSTEPADSSPQPPVHPAPEPTSGPTPETDS